MTFRLIFLKYVRKLRIASVLLKVTPTTRLFLCVSVFIINSYITPWIDLFVSGRSYIAMFVMILCLIVMR